MRLTVFECPNCGASEMVSMQNQQLVCAFCGTTFGQVARICPQCGHYNEASGRHCALCGAQILRDCPACGADNWALADHCLQCGRNLDLIERLARRWQKTTQQQLYERQAAMVSLKEQQERASQTRMASFLEAERTRQEALAQAREVQWQRDRQIYVLIGVAVFAFVVIVVLTLLLAPGTR
jgi:predicted amidophosphoribosyltransferase